MCLECCRRRLPELIAHCEREGMRLRRGRILVCCVAHGDHSHLRFRARGNSQIHSPWFQMPASLAVLLQVLPPAKFSIHLHDPWDQDPVEPKGLDSATKTALTTHRHTFARLRLDDTCPICLDIVPPYNVKPAVVASSEGSSGGGDAGGTTTLPCGHAFHDGCCGEWFSRSKKCPTCRFELTVASIEAAAARVKCLETSGEYEECEKGLGWLVAETTKAGGLAQKQAVDDDVRVQWGEEDEEVEETEDEEDFDERGWRLGGLVGMARQRGRFSFPNLSSPFRRTTPVSPSSSSQRRATLSAMFRHGRHSRQPVEVGEDEPPPLEEVPQPSDMVPQPHVLENISQTSSE